MDRISLARPFGKHQRENYMYENKSHQETLESFSVSKETGLTQQQVEAQHAKYGPNKLDEKGRDPWYKIFWGNIKDPMTGILAVAALISLVLAIIGMNRGTEGPESLADVFIIFGVVLLNAAIGTIQEMRAEKALEALKNLSAPTATVRRDGKIMEIKAEELVPGDIVILEEGRTIPADLRLLTSVSLKADEASLTGESVPVEKNADLVLTEEVGVGDRVNEVYMSTPVVYGRGEGVVIATGMNTEIGKIADMLSGEGEEQTPLQKKLAGLSKFLGILTVVIVVLMLVVKIVWAVVQSNIASAWAQALLDSVALAVAAIPEGLTAVVTIVLAMGMTKMVKVNTIVRRLASVETLGAVSVICSDKTGTLTQNKMTVVRAYVDDEVELKDHFDAEKVRLLAEGLSLCSDAKIEGGVYGDPTEVALVEFASSLGMPKSSLEEKLPRVGELPFDSVRKMMSTLHKSEKGNILFTKGAMDQILKHCDRILRSGEVRPITPEDVAAIQNASADMAADALRVLALAYSEKSEVEEENLIFVGLVGMVDPPREAAAPAVATLKSAGITTIMITGDHRDTAFAIAKELGIAESKDQVMSGDQIDECSEEELREKVKTVRVFARVSPSNKVSIVKAIKANGLIAAMTGDGVNDAPSLKAADIGIAMGITGTDVAKGAADMVLTDDNFASIEKAVEEGRGIYANIKKTILFLLSSNIGEVICMFVAACFGLPSPLIAIHLLWVNLITDSLPAIALGADKKPDDIMSEKPRDAKESLFAHGGYLLTFGYGILIGVVTLLAFLVNAWQEGHFAPADISAFFGDTTPVTATLTLGEQRLETAQAMAFCVLSFSELFHMLGMVNIRKSFVLVFKDKNLLLWISFILGMGLQFFVIFTPGVNTIFKVIAPVGVDWAWVFGLALMPLFIHEIVALALFIKKKAKR